MIHYRCRQRWREAEIGNLQVLLGYCCRTVRRIRDQVLAGPLQGTIAQILTRHVFEAPVLPRQRVPERDIPARLDELVGAMLRKSR